MQIYLDESGDLGWKFDAPFGKGGSSRYLLLAFLFVPLPDRKRPRNLIVDLYSYHNWIGEKKASTASLAQKIKFCENTVSLLHKYPQIKIDVIVVNKINVQQHIRKDANKLYNYMAGLVIPENIKAKEKVEFIPDKRSVKVKSGNSLVDYLQTKIWCEHNYPTEIIFNPRESNKVYNLQFVDWIAHCLWLYFEFGINEPYNVLNLHMRIRRLFFASAL